MTDENTTVKKTKKTTTTSKEAAVVKFTDTSWGCFHHKGRSYERKLTSTQYEELLNVITRTAAAPLAQEEFTSTAATTASAMDDIDEQILAYAGITRDSYRSSGAREKLLKNLVPHSWRERRHHKDLKTSAILTDIFQNKGEKLGTFAPEIDSLVTYEAVANKAWTELSRGTMGSWCTTTSSFEVVLKAPNSDTAILSVSSNNRCPGMLPWTIRQHNGKQLQGDHTWRSADIRITQAIVNLGMIDPQGNCAKAHLLGSADYWPSGFLEATDSMSWDHNQHQMDELLCREFYTQLDGFGEANTLFTVDNALTGCINFHPESMNLTLRARDDDNQNTNHSLIDDVWWFNLFQDEHSPPQHNWKHLLTIYHKASRIAQEKMPWLLEWKETMNNSRQKQQENLETKKRSGPSIRLSVVGVRAFTERDLDYSVMPCWNQASFQGSPTYSLLLSRPGGDMFGDVYFNEEDPRVLVTRAEPPRDKKAQRHHWLDDYDVNYHPRGKTDFLVVHAHGTCYLSQTD